MGRRSSGNRPADPELLVASLNCISTDMRSSGLLRRIIGAGLHFRFLVLGIAAMLVLFGSLGLRWMPVDVLPEFAPPIVEVQTEAIGLSAEEVEKLITLNLEELLSGVPWLQSIRSSSVTGLSSIVLTFEWGTDIMQARQMIQERLTLAYTLPNVAQPPVILQPLSSTSRFMMVGIASDDIETTELSLLARWMVKPKLLGVPGVANVAIWGQRLRQLHVQIDPDRLHDARLIQEDIIAAAGDALWVSPLTFLRGSAPGTGGWIDNPNQRLSVQHAMPIESPEDMAKVPVAPKHLLLSGRSMSLGEVTEVTFAHPPIIGDSILNKGEGLVLVLEKYPSSNTLEVTRGVEQALEELSQGLPGVAIDTHLFRLASYVEDSISNLIRTALIGAVFLVLAVRTFLSGWRITLISFVAITLSLFAAIFALYLADATINTLIIAGLLVALAVVIDDAIVEVERLVRSSQRAGARGKARPAILRESAQETGRLAIYATLIIMLSVAPVFFMGGVSGGFFEPMALSYVLAVAASMGVALIVTPALSLLVLGKAMRTDPGGPIENVLHAGYGRVFRRITNAPATVFVIASVLLVAGIGVWPFLGQSLLPTFIERHLLVTWATPPGTSHSETYRITSRVSSELRALPGVASVGAHVGRAVTGDQVVGVNSAQIWVGIDPNGDYDATVAAIREIIDGYVGIQRGLHSYLRDKVGEALTGEGKVIVVRIYGQKGNILAQLAEEVRWTLTGIEGVVDLRADGQAEEPQVQVRVKLDAASKAAVKPGDVRRASSTVFSGLVVGYLFKDQKMFEVVVWGTPEARQSLTDLQDLWIDKPDRAQVRLGDVADVSVVATPTVIRHERTAPYVDVVANVAGRDPASVVAEIEDRLKEVQFPLEYHPEILGEYAERESAQQRILDVALASVIGIFLLLQACFQSWRLALIVFLALPAAFVGGVLGVSLTGGVVSLGSIVGFIAVLGIAPRSGIFLIDRYQRLREREGVPLDLELVLRATRERLTPALASLTAIIVSLLPIILVGRAPGLEILQPITVVLVGGLITSSVFTFLVLPALYLAVGSKAERRSDLGLTF